MYSWIITDIQVELNNKQENFKGIWEFVEIWKQNKKQQPTTIS